MLNHCRSTPLRFLRPYLAPFFSQTKQHLAIHFTLCALSFASFSLFYATLMLRSRWSVASFSAFTSFFMVLCATLQVLASFNDVRYRYYAPGEAPAAALPSNGTTSSSNVLIPIPNKYEDTMDTLYSIGLGTLSLVGVGVFPMCYRAAWTPFVVPLVYLVVTGAYPQPLERFLQVSLLNFLLLLQVRAGRTPRASARRN